MAIKFNCPHCERPITVREQLAGKRGHCPGCKKVITIPVPRQNAAAPPVEEVEQLAASTLVDEPPPEAPPDTRTVDFTCPQCDEPVKVGIELEGKQTPCPSCRRIIKVPLLEKRDPKDWRKVDLKRPSLAKQDEAPAPEGAWGSTTSTTGVSRESLVEAGAIKVPVERTTPQQWARRITVVLVVLVVLGGGTWWGLSAWAKGRLNRMVASAISSVSDGTTPPKLSPEKDAAVHLAAAEFHLRSGKPDSVKEAKKHFGTAFTLLEKANLEFDHDALLIDLALAELDLGEYDATWESARGMALQSLQKLSPSKGLYGPRGLAVRLVVRKLIDKNQPQVAFSLASELSHDRPGQSAAPEVAEATAIASLELLAASKTDLADRLVAEPLRSFAGDQPANPENPQAPKGRPIDVPSLVAYLVLKNDKNLKPVVSPPNPIGPVDPAVGLGYVEAWARTPEKLGDACKLIDRLGPANDRVEGFLALATAGNSSDDLKQALTLAEDELSKGSDVSPWLLLRLAQVGANAGLNDEALAVAKATKDRVAASRMQLAVVLAQLRADKFDAGLADRIDPQTTAYAQAREALARYAARNGEGLAKEVDNWDVALRPFGQLGVALGTQDHK